MRLPVMFPGNALPMLFVRWVMSRPDRLGDHVRLTTQQHGEHHVSIPLHDSLRVGTLAAILADVGQHFSLSREELLRRLSL